MKRSRAVDSPVESGLLAVAAPVQSVGIGSTFLSPAPFDDDPKAMAERQGCDYSFRLTFDDAKKGNVPRRPRVYADGIYDLFHAGHARQLMQAKNLFPNAYLIVGVCNDALTNERKGCTVMDENERYEGIRHCRYVDEVVRNAPWTLDDEYLNKHKIDFVAHDDIPYTTGSEGDVYAEIKAKGMFATTQRTAGVSTSDIVARIVKDYDVYVRRNLARGYTPKDLNVSFLKGKKFELMNKMDFMRDRGKKAFQGLGEKRNELIRGWEERSSSMISGFLRFFGQENLSNMWEQSKGVIMRALSPVPGEEEEEDEANNGHSSAPSSPRAKRRRSPNAVLEADPSLLEEYSSDDEH